jgi:hypothetical protein
MLLIADTQVASHGHSTSNSRVGTKKEFQKDQNKVWTDMIGRAQPNKYREIDGGMYLLAPQQYVLKVPCM